MQIHPGHAILEGRKPALLDSLVQVGVLQCHQLVCTKGNTQLPVGLYACVEALDMHPAITTQHVWGWRHPVGVGVHSAACNVHFNLHPVVGVLTRGLLWALNVACCKHTHNPDKVGVLSSYLTKLCCCCCVMVALAGSDTGATVCVA